MRRVDWMRSCRAGRGTDVPLGVCCPPLGVRAGTAYCGIPGDDATFPSVMERSLPELSPARVRLALLALALGGFGIGCTEFVAMGLLPNLARDLLPEALAASRAALRERMQTSLNLAYGSAMASIGLTIPAIAVASIWLEGPLVLGLGATQMVLLTITVVVGALTVLPGRATVQQGGVHLVLLAAFLFLAVNP